MRSAAGNRRCRRRCTEARKCRRSPSPRHPEPCRRRHRGACQVRRDLNSPPLLGRSVGRSGIGAATEADRAGRQEQCEDSQEAAERFHSVVRSFHNGRVFSFVFNSRFPAAARFPQVRLRSFGLTKTAPFFRVSLLNGEALLSGEKGFVYSYTYKPPFSRHDSVTTSSKLMTWIYVWFNVCMYRIRLLVTKQK